jgi:uncharacterized secreted protein with C-terminal beta-propeller domain
MLKSRDRFILHLSILFMFTIVSACSNSGKDTAARSTPPPDSARLAKPVDNSQLETWLKAELVKSYQHSDVRYHYAALGSLNSAGAVPAPVFAASVPGATDAQSSVNGQSRTYSTTNVQENGVDEGDLVKTDGEYIYLARGSHFLVLRGQPVAQAAVVSDIDLKEQIIEIHLHGTRVSLLTVPYSYAGMMPEVLPPVGVSAGSADPAVSGKKARLISPEKPATSMYSYDVASPPAPRLLTRLDFPGSFQGSRRINNTIYLITNHRIDLPVPVSAANYMNPDDYSMDSYNRSSALALAENLRRIDALTLGDMLPTYRLTPYSAGIAGTPVVTPVVTGSDVYIPENGNGTDLSLVIAVDAAADTPIVASSGVISAWCQMYMSAKSLYLASSNNWSWIEPLSGTAPSIINPEPWTAVHKFSIDTGTVRPLYKGSGIVAGWVNNQFSMGEYNGLLRIGTTRGGWWGESISNRLAVMSEEDGTLVEKGKIEDLAPGEKIYSMRFDRNRGYMVTFRQTDPLFTFDLSDPGKPKVAGEIKVNGFATYIHLLGQDNNRLLTVGRSADANGRITGNKLQLFDVTNLAAPSLLGEYEFGSGWSDALYDYHAFLYHEPLGLLAIPYYSYDTAAVSSGYSSGLRVFKVAASSLVNLGTIPARVVTSGFGNYNDTVDRSVIIDNYIYAIAHRSVTMADLKQLEILRVIGLPESYSYYYAL